MAADCAPIPEALLCREAEDIAARYRVTVEDAMAALREAFAAVPALSQRVRKRQAEEDVTRWRDYREVVRRCRHEIYYSLRRYYPPSGEAARLVEEFEQEARGEARPQRIEELRRALLAAHKSTSERMPHYEEFYEKFFALVGTPAALLDVGCGMHPLSYPFSGAGRDTRHYVAVDKDECAVQAVRAYADLAAPGRLLAVEAQLDSVTWMDGLPYGGPFELTVMLKIVPVLIRLDRGPVMRLAATPARRVLLTGNVQSMTRRETIEARERMVLQRFIEWSGRRVAQEFRVGDEFGYVLE